MNKYFAQEIKYHTHGIKYLAQQMKYLAQEMKYLAQEIIATLQRKWAAARGHQHCSRPGWVLCFSCGIFYLHTWHILYVLVVGLFTCILDTFFMIVSNPFRWQRYWVDGCKRSYFFPDEGTIQVRYTSQCSGSAALSINFLVCIKSLKKWFSFGRGEEE